jgi:hypothetical protein
LGASAFAVQAQTAKPDPYTQGAKSGKPDPFTDGAKTGKPDPYTDGAKAGKAPALVAGNDRTGVSATPSRKPDPYTDGAKVGDKFDPYTSGANKNTASALTDDSKKAKSSSHKPHTKKPAAPAAAN